MSDKYWEQPGFPKDVCGMMDHDSDPDHCITACEARESWFVASLAESQARVKELENSLEVEGKCTVHYRAKSDSLEAALVKSQTRAKKAEARVKFLEDAIKEIKIWIRLTKIY